MTDLIKRDDALAAIDTFERDFEQSWRVQLRANIDAIPAVKDDLIEQLERERDAYAEHLMVAAKTFSEMHIEKEQLLDKISEMKSSRSRLKLVDGGKS
jgi:hypothetical protein